MQIKLNLKVFLFLLIFLITKQIKIYALIMLFALLHELGHLLMGVILGYKAESISIIPTGFCIKFRTTCNDYNKKIKKANLLSVKKILIALAGPLTNLIIILGTVMYYKMAENNIVDASIIESIIYSNILIFVFNMLPIYPLDGGRIIKEIICIAYGRKKSHENIFKISNVTVIILTISSSIFVLQFHNISVVLIIAYLWYIVIKENYILKLYLQTYRNYDTM